MTQTVQAQGTIPVGILRYDDGLPERTILNYEGASQTPSISTIEGTCTIDFGNSNISITPSGKININSRSEGFNFRAITKSGYQTG